MLVAADASDDSDFSETVWQKFPYAFMRSLAKSVPYYLVTKKKQLIEVSHLPCSEELKGSSRKRKLSLKPPQVEYLVHKIILNSIVHVPVVNENDKFVLIAQRILNCIFDSHSYAYKVSDFESYDWKCLFIEDIRILM